MDLSIRQASQFVIGTVLLQRQAMVKSNNPNLDFDTVANIVNSTGEEGNKLRQAVKKLADGQAEWFRNNPPHTMQTERVINSRKAEINAFMAIQKAVVNTISNLDKLHRSDITDSLVLDFSAAYTAIDDSPGSVHDHRGLTSSFHQQIKETGIEPEMANNLLKQAEKHCLAEQAQRILSRYDRTSDSDIDYGV